MIHMNKHIYLYLVTLTMKDAEKYYYVGIRSCKCEPEDDTKYRGSPKTYKHMWSQAETIKKDIIISLPHNKENHENLSAKEMLLIKEAHTRYGLKGKDDDGKCLNAGMFPNIFFTEEVRAKKIASHNTPEARAKNSANMKEYIKNNPDALAKLIASHNTPEARANKSNSKKEYLKNNPDALAKHIANMHTPEARAKKSASMKEYLKNNPDARANMSANMKDYYKNNPDALAKHIANMHTPEARAKNIASLKTPEYRAKQSARVKEYLKNNPDALAKRIANLHSPEARAKKIANKKTCEVCSKTMNIKNFVRHNHGENCKRG